MDEYLLHGALAHMEEWRMHCLQQKERADKLEAELKEARAAFDAAMEYADSAEIYKDEWGHCVDILRRKPRPVAPWKGE